MRNAVALFTLTALAGLFAYQREANAEKPTDAASRARCSSRLVVSITGQGATDAQRAWEDPQAHVDELLKAPQFSARFARFLNAEMNPEVSTIAAEDATFFLAKYVLDNDLPYKDLFMGKYRVVEGANPNLAVVEPDPAGLGYFRSKAWMVRYAGNEEVGIRLPAAYRMMQNTVGLELTAVTNADGVDVSAGGRSKGVCKGCHYDSWSALDKVASVLTRRKGQGDTMTFTAQGSPSSDMGGVPITDDASVVQALVSSENFSFNVCRLSFKFLYGRPENTCESKVFDACIDAFKASGKIQSAIGTIAKDSGYCQ